MTTFNQMLCTLIDTLKIVGQDTVDFIQAHRPLNTDKRNTGQLQFCLSGQIITDRRDNNTGDTLISHDFSQQMLLTSWIIIGQIGRQEVPKGCQLAGKDNDQMGVNDTLCIGNNQGNFRILAHPQIASLRDMNFGLVACFLNDLLNDLDQFWTDVPGLIDHMRNCRNRDTRSIGDFLDSYAHFHAFFVVLRKG